MIDLDLLETEKPDYESIGDREERQCLALRPKNKVGEAIELSGWKVDLPEFWAGRNVAGAWAAPARVHNRHAASLRIVSRVWEG